MLEIGHVTSGDHVSAAQLQGYPHVPHCTGSDIILISDTEGSTSLLLQLMSSAIDALKLDKCGIKPMTSYTQCQQYNMQACQSHCKGFMLCRQYFEIPNANQTTH